MKLFTWGIAPNPRRVEIFLAEKEIQIPVEEVGVPGKAFLKPEFLESHAHRRVPLLQLDDGSYIGEAMAICRYFETLHPEPPLMGTSPQEIAQIEMWERLAELDGMQAIAEFYRNSKGSFADRSLPGYSNSLQQIPALIERGKARLEQFYLKFDAQLAANEYVAGEKFTVADITSLCVIDFAAFSELGIPEECSNLQRWYHVVSERPSLKK
ncbi:MAG: glutathione S-transferase [Rhodospirillaceae bacterium]|nr:glutathione S-transferase [Rhodospirillaceae bacterium]|tara:strand:+ start:421 stop:1053 length:633 start_codon:yes stop_codon:yes gene_type:complete